MTWEALLSDGYKFYATPNYDIHKVFKKWGILLNIHWDIKALKILNKLSKEVFSILLVFLKWRRQNSVLIWVGGTDFVGKTGKICTLWWLLVFLDRVCHEESECCFSSCGKEFYQAVLMKCRCWFLFMVVDISCCFLFYCTSLFRGSFW